MRATRIALRGVFLATFAVLLLPAAAEAGFALRFSDGADTRTIRPGDGGNVVLLRDFDKLGITLVIGLMKSSAGSAELELASLVSSRGPGHTITFDLTATGFGSGPAAFRMDHFQTALWGIAFGTAVVAVQSWVNYGPGGNQEFGGLDATTGQVATSGPLGLFSGDLLTGGNDLPVSVEGPFSVTTRFQFTPERGDGIALLLADVTLDGSPVILESLSEPPTVALFLLGLPVLGLPAWWRSRKPAPPAV